MSDPYPGIEVAPSKRSMHVYTLQRDRLVPLAPLETFGFFADAFNLEAITPPWLGFEARAILVRRDLDRIFDYRRDAVAFRLGSA